MTGDDMPIEHKIYAGISADGSTLLAAPVNHFGVLILNSPQTPPGQSIPEGIALRIHFVGPSDDNLPITVAFDLEQARKLHQNLTDALALLDS